jgi:organic hydroperoxide reductase OsmC/OhrA
VVPGIDADTFAKLADVADKHCPVSNLLRPGLSIEIDTELLS